MLCQRICVDIIYTKMLVDRIVARFVDRIVDRIVNRFVHRIFKQIVDRMGDIFLGRNARGPNRGTILYQQNATTYVGGGDGFRRAVRRTVWFRRAFRRRSGGRVRRTKDPSPFPPTSRQLQDQLHNLSVRNSVFHLCV